MPLDDFEEIATVRVTRPEPPGRWRAAGILAALALILVVAKPWGINRAPAGDRPTARPPAPTATPRPVGRHYDPALFGRYEVAPAWEIWPAGYVYKFGIAGPLTLTPRTPPPSDPGGASPDPDVTPAPPTPRRTPAPTPPPGARELIDLGSSDHLVVVALNTPADVAVTGVRLWTFDASGRATELDVIELPPPWPVTYFHVYGLPATAPPDQLAVWAPGAYRLDVTTRRDGVRRIGFHVAPGAGDAPAVSAAPAP
jgi:hypothetical protein